MGFPPTRTAPTGSPPARTAIVGSPPARIVDPTAEVRRALQPPRIGGRRVSHTSIPARVRALRGHVSRGPQRRCASRSHKSYGLVAPSLVHGEARRWAHRSCCNRLVKGLDPCLSESGLDVFGCQSPLQRLASPLTQLLLSHLCVLVHHSPRVSLFPKCNLKWVKACKI